MLHNKGGEGGGGREAGDEREVGWGIGLGARVAVGGGVGMGGSEWERVGVGRREWLGQLGGGVSGMVGS